MTPQEQELINGLFDRLSRLETQPRDGEAERLIAQGLSRAPHAIYALVQTVLVQDEALKVANARIEQLQAAMGSAGQSERPSGGFLDNMREALFGSEPRRPGAVPSVGPRPTYASPPPGYAPPPPSYGPQAGYAPPGGGPSFLGTAAAAAAGTIGGSLLLGGIRSMLGGAGHGAFAGTFDGLAGGAPNEYGRGQDSPWGGPDDLANQAGANDIGGDDYAGPDDVADSDAGSDYDDGSFDDDSGGGSDYA